MDPATLGSIGGPASGADRARRLRPAALVVAMGLLLATLPASDVAAQDAATTSPAPAPSANEPIEVGDVEVPPHLADELAAALARFPDLTASGRVGIVAVTPDGQSVWGHDADVGMIPASTMKALSATAVLDAFGLDGTVTTSVRSRDPIEPDGTVDGPLVLRGRGDPTLTSDDYRRWVYPARPATAIEDLADDVVAAGVQRVTGGVIGDGSLFGPASRAAAGWPERYFGDFDAHNLSALTIDTGRRVEVSTGGGAPTVRITQHPDPALRAAEIFARSLADRGVVIEGRITSWIRPPTTMETTIASVDSPPMRDAVTFMLQESDNHLADQLVRAAALATDDDGSWEAAGDGIRRVLGDAGVPTTGFVLSDGSGLSRTNRVSADLLARNDRAAHQRWGQAWSSMLPVAGESGTLENRLVGTAAQGRLVAKTGTLGDVRGLAGHVIGPDEDHYHFALVVNDVSDDIRWQASVLGDELALVLADALDGCRRFRVVQVPAPAPSSSSVTPSLSPSGTPSGAAPSPTASATPEPVRRTVPATSGSPGPNLSSDAWDRQCPA